MKFHILINVYLSVVSAGVIGMVIQLLMLQLFLLLLLLLLFLVLLFSLLLLLMMMMMIMMKMMMMGMVMLLLLLTSCYPCCYKYGKELSPIEWFMTPHSTSITRESGFLKRGFLLYCMKGFVLTLDE